MGGKSWLRKRVENVVLPLLVVWGLLVTTALALPPGETTPGMGQNISPSRPEFAGALGLPFQVIPNQGQVAPEVKYYHQGPDQGIYFTGQGLWLRFSRSVEGATDRKLRLRDSGKGRQSALIRLTLLNLNKDTAIVPVEPQAGKVNYFLGKRPEKWRLDLPTYGGVVYREAYPGIDLKFYGTGRQLEYDVIVRPGADPNRVKFQYHGVDSLRVTPEGDLAISLPDGGSLIQKKPMVYQEIAGHRVAREGTFKLYPGSGRQVFGFTVASYDRSQSLVIDPVLVFSSYLGGTGEDAGKALTVDADGNMYVAGWTTSADFPTTSGAVQPQFKGIAPQTDAFLAKFSPTGALVFATYLGGTSGDGISGVALEWNGNIYLVGSTTSDDFPTTVGAVQTAYHGGGDAFVTKLTPNGNSLLFSTYLGGTGFEEVESNLAVDAEGNAYITGETASIDFPVTDGAFQSTPGGGYDGFVAKLNHMGTSLIFATYLGGSGDDRGRGIALDAQDNVYVTGETKSANFPTSSNPFQKNHAGAMDAFVTKFTTDGSLVYSSFLGGSNTDGGHGIAVDGSGCAYITGETYSDNFPTSPDALQKSQAAYSDAFVTKVNQEGTALLYSTYLGGDGHDSGNAIAVDSRGRAYIAGQTDSTNFPVLKAFQTRKKGLSDAFVAKLNPMGSRLLFSTYLGGDGDDQGESLALGAPGLVYVSGRTESSNFPVKNPYQANLKGTLDAFVVKMVENEPVMPELYLLLMGD
jgi:hypothetical protein